MIPAVAAPLVANAEGTQPAVEEKQIPLQVEFVLADSTVVGTSNVNLTVGAHKFSELSLPQGYELVRDDTFTVANAADIFQVTVRATAAEEEVTTAIANVQFVDADGNAVGGGYYTLPAGVQNISILSQYVKEGTNEVVGEDEAYTADGVKGEVHTFTVDLKAPKGYELVDGEDSLTLDVEYGQSAEAFVKVKAVEDKNEGKKDEEKKTKRKILKKKTKVLIQVLQLHWLESLER